MDMLEGKRKSYRNSVRLYALLHDAHEAAWGDIPTPLKTEDIRKAQREMDRKIYAMLEIPDIPPQYEPIIKRADTRAMLAEGAVIGPLGWYERYAAANPEIVDDYKRYARGDREIVATLAATYPDCRHTFSASSPAVTEYLRSLEEAIEGSGLRECE